MTYQYLLFDLDGTISESAPGIIRAVKYGLSAVGIEETDPAVLHTFIGPPLNVQMRKLYHMSDEDIRIAVTKFRELYETKGGIFECSPYDGIGDLLKEAREKGYILAVASSKPEPFVKQIMDHFGFTDYFHVICGSDAADELNKKASQNQKTRIIQKALDALEAKGFSKSDMAGHTVMIGDTGYDVDGAKDHHLPCIGVTYGYGSREELAAHGAEYVVDNVVELRKLLFNECEVRNA